MVANATWTALVSGDWNTASDWSGSIVPNSNTADVLIGGAATTYIVTIGSGESEIVNAITLGDVNGAHKGPTLDVAGTLTFAGSSPGMAFLSGGLTIGSTGVLDGMGSLGTVQTAGPFVLLNQGTVHSDAGAGNQLGILVGFNNQGTVLADNGSVGLEGGNGVANLSGSTLTGGTWIAQGPTSGTVNQIEFGFNYDATIAVDAANIVLDGAASEIDGFVGPIHTGSFQPLEQQLQTIASTGTLQVLGGRGYVTTNTLTDAGELIVAGGTLSTGGLTVGSLGFFEGYGVVQGSVGNQGAIIADGGTLGALDIQGAVTGTGALTVMPNSTLVLSGGTPSVVNNSGTLYDTSGLLTINTLLGSGTLVVQSGATIDLGAATTQAVVFAGSNATLQLDNPAQYKGALTGIGQGDKLIVTGITADTATVVNSNTLAVISGGSTIDSFLLGGNYTGVTFGVTPFGAGVTIQATSSAPPRDDMPVTITLNDSAGLSGAEETLIENDLSAAAADWGQYITGHAPLRITLNISNTSGGSELANAGPGALVPTGQVVNGETILEPNSLIALLTGNYVAGTTADVVVNLPAASGALSQLYINPSPFTSGGTVPAGKFDLLTVFRHELAHELGFTGLTDPTTGALGPDATLYDTYIHDTISGGFITAANFIGPNAEAAYGALLGTGIPTPVPLTLLNNGENFFHFANLGGEPLGHDLMSGVGLLAGTSIDISAVDLAVLLDIGAPLTGGPVCFARGTQIATPDGETPVERLAIGDSVLTLQGKAERIVWIGVGRVLVTPGHRSAATPVIVRKGALADNVPHRDLHVTKGHSLLIDDVLIPVEFLVNHRSIIWDDRAREIEIYHIELAQHAVLVADGAPAESYRDDGNRWLFQNANATAAPTPQPPCAPLLTGGAIVDAAWRRLLDRAGPRPGLPITDAPDLHLLVDGQRVDGTVCANGVHVFRLPKRPGCVRIASRAGVPQELGIARDPRMLGVALRQIVCWRAARLRVMEAADPSLDEGFHPFEAANGFRWTDGNALLPAAMFDGVDGECELELHVACTTRYPLLDDRIRVAA